MIHFVIYGTPSTTAQQKGIRVSRGRALHFTKDEVLTEAYRLHAGAIKHRPKVPLSGVPLVVTYLVIFPMTKAQIKEAGLMEGLATADEILDWKLSAPDWDNSVKTLQDVLSAPRGKARGSIPKLSFWSDDSLIADAHVYKRAGFVPRIEVTIQEAVQLRPLRQVGGGLVP